MGKYDLHMHSRASDGELSPAALVQRAAKVGVTTLALSDHDTLNGLSQAREAAEEVGIAFVNGVELSTYADTEIHMLGYNFDPNNPILVTTLQDLAVKRRQRAEMILQKLAEFKIKIDASELDADASVGRAHIAKLLVKKGYCASVSEAFTRYLGDKGIAYLPSRRLLPKEGARLIKQVGGLSVIAHPARLLESGKLPDLIERLLPEGLNGLEAYYPSHDAATTATLIELCTRYGLIATGGTDFHGGGHGAEVGSLDWSPDERTAKALGLE